MHDMHLAVQATKSSVYRCICLAVKASPVFHSAGRCYSGYKKKCFGGPKLEGGAYIGSAVTKSIYNRK